VLPALWGVVLARNLDQREMERAAAVEPTRITNPQLPRERRSLLALRKGSSNRRIS
jgi:hypothetical protein